MNKKMCLFFTFFFIVSFAAAGIAREYKVAIKEMPSTNEYVALIKAIAEATGNTVNIQVLPYTRSEVMLAENQVDIQIPQLKLQTQAASKFDYSSMVMFETAFILYSNKDKPIDMKSLSMNTKLVIETDPTLVNSFNIKCSSSNNLELSFKKLSAGRIDGVLMSQFSGDTFLKKAGVKNINRQLYLNAPVCMSIKKGTVGGEVDKMLLDGANKLKASGKYNQIMGNLIKNAKFDNWQP